MNIPGFTAGASLYQTNTRFRIAIIYASYGGSPIVLPARDCTECFCDVLDYGFPGTCAKLCFNKPGDLEYPVLCLESECNPSCDKPTCGPCTQTCSYPGGGSFTQPC